MTLGPDLRRNGTWSIKTQHNFLSWNFFSLPTDQNTDILFGGDQIYAAEYKFTAIYDQGAVVRAHTVY